VPALAPPARAGVSLRDFVVKKTDFQIFSKTSEVFVFYGVFLTNILLVGVGGFIGSVLRYLASGYVQQATKSIDFPYGTLAVNVIGCFIIGFLSQLAEERGVFTSESRLFVFTGFLGGFTTFSSFGNETLNLARDSQMMNALANVGANVVLGLLAVWLGRTVSYLIWR
jgi:CrcB protein